MAEIAPFRAIRYDFNRVDRDISRLIAPPYDVLNKDDKTALLQKDPHNIVAIDLPHLPPKEEGPKHAYLDAQAALTHWLDDGVLVRESRPALYAYHQTFEHDGRPLTRRQLIARVRLHEFSEGIVLPHEETFGGPKADRLALTKATRCNVSPVLGMFTDPDRRVEHALSQCADRDADATGAMDTVRHEVWIIDDASAIAALQTAMADKKIYIADGHHRYGTALNYRAFVAEQSGGSLADDHPANYVMLVLASMDDPGCVILGYNRVLLADGVTIANLLDAWSQGAQPCSADQAELTLYEGATRKSTHVQFTHRSVMDEIAADHHPSWRKLDIAYLHRYLIDRLAAAKWPSPTIRYVRSEGDARALAESESGVALIPKPTPMEHLRAVSEAGELMPQKSTYFHPKVATGLTLNPLE